MYGLSYVSVVVDFLQTIIWKSLFAAAGARWVRAQNTRILYLLRSLYLHPNINLSLNLSIFTHRSGRELVRVRQHSILEACAYQLRIYKSAFYSYNFHSFVYLDLEKKRVMCIVLWSPCAFVTITSERPAMRHVCIKLRFCLCWFLANNYLEISICRRLCKVSLERRTHELYICCDRFIYIQK